MKHDYSKLKIVIRYWLLGKGYFNAVKAMGLAEKHHTGKRLDGEEEFSHQIRIAIYMRSFDGLIDYPEETFCAIFLHDIIEDYGVTVDQINIMFGDIVGKAVLKLTKIVDGYKMTSVAYYDGMITDDTPESQICALVKGADRIDNLLTMVGGYSAEKQVKYIAETLEYVVPMLKLARKTFPKQEIVFHNMKYVIANNVKLYNEINDLTIKNLDV